MDHQRPLSTPRNTVYDMTACTLSNKETGVTVVYHENGEPMVNWCGTPTPYCFALAKFLAKDTSPYLGTDATPKSIPLPSEYPTYKGRGGKGYGFDTSGMNYAGGGVYDKEKGEFRGEGTPKPWRVRFRRKGQFFSFGYYETEAEAARVAAGKMALSFEELMALRGETGRRGNRKYGLPAGISWDKVREQYRVRVSERVTELNPDGTERTETLYHDAGYSHTIAGAKEKLKALRAKMESRMHEEDTARAGIPTKGINWDSGRGMFRARGKTEDNKEVHLGYHKTKGEAAAAVMQYYQGRKPVDDREAYKYITQVKDQWVLRISVNGKQRSFGVHDTIGEALLMRHAVMGYMSKGVEPPTLAALRFELGLVSSESKRRTAMAKAEADRKTFEEAGYD